MSIAVITLCVLGRPVRKAKLNSTRLDLLARAAEAAARLSGGGADAVLTPAGFLKLKLKLGFLSWSQRISEVGEHSVGRACQSIAGQLEAASGAKLVVGFDTISYGGFGPDQMIAVFNGDRVVGCIRKAFPSASDASGETVRPYRVFEHDACAAGRTARLGSAVAALGVCYDGFAFVEAWVGPTAKRRHIAYVADDQIGWRWANTAEQNAIVNEFARINQSKPGLALIAIHGFERPGRELYWQRHGIAAASAALGGALVVGAAHYAKRLPDPEAALAGTLAAIDVPKDHLWAGLRRKAYGLRPERWTYVRDQFGVPVGLLRLFQT